MDGELQTEADRPEVTFSEIATRLDELNQNVLFVQQQIAVLVGTVGRESNPPTAHPSDPGQQQLHLTGRVAPRGSSNIVEVAGTEVQIPDSSFARLLCLIARSRETQDGFVDGDQFAATGRPANGPALEINAAYQAAHRLRDPLRPFLGRDFVQVRERNVRLDPELQVAWQSARLLQHPNREIAELASLLPTMRL